MSITENSVLAGILTFIFYGVVPVSIIYYIGSSRARKKKREDKKKLD